MEVPIDINKFGDKPVITLGRASEIVSAVLEYGVTGTPDRYNPLYHGVMEAREPWMAGGPECRGWEQQEVATTRP